MDPSELHINEGGTYRPYEHPAWILFSATLMYLSSFLVYPLMPTIVETLSPDLSSAAMNVGIMYVTQSVLSFIVSPLIGLWSDRVGRKPVLLFCQTVALVSLTLIAVAIHTKTLWMLFVTRLVSLLFAQQTYFAYLSDISHTPKDRSTNFGFLGAGCSTALIFGPIGGGVIGSYSLIYPILLSACVMILNIFFIVAFINHHEEHKRSDMDLSQVWSLLGRIFKTPSWRLLVFIKLIMTIGSQDVNEMFFLYAPVRFSLTPIDIGLLAAFVGVIQVIWKGFILKWLVSYGDEAVYLPASSLTSAVSHIGIGILNNLVLLYMLAAAAGMGVVAQTVIDSMISIRASKKEQGSILGIIGSIGTVGEVIGGTAVSLIYSAVIDEHDIQSVESGAPFFAGSGMHLIVFLLWILWFRLYKDEQKEFHNKMVKETEESEAEMY